MNSKRENPEWRSSFSEMEMPISVSSDDFLLSIHSLISKGGRVDVDQCELLFNHPNLSGIFSLGLLLKKARFGEEVFFNENLHVNTTNVCVLACRFCAFRKGPRHQDAYSLSTDEYLARIRPFSDRIDEVHSVGGLHPSWTVDHYVELYHSCKDEFPHIHIKSLTAVEVKHIADRSGLSVEETLSKLKDAGLNSLPGGGAEILVDSVRNRICRGKESSDEYLGIHGVAHSIGIPTNCTMLFGTVETLRERAIHLVKLREQQDESEGFQCFVPYPFLPDKTRLPEAQLASLNEILRVIAISRIMLDNIPHIKAYRMNLGAKAATLALLAGADDFDGTVSQEEIMQEAGSIADLNSQADDLAKIIEDVDCIPIKRNSIYTKFVRHERRKDGNSRALPMAQPI